MAFGAAGSDASLAQLRAGIVSRLPIPESWWAEPYPADSSLVTAQARVSSWGGLDVGTKFGGGTQPGALYHVRKAVLIYNSALNGTIGTNNSNWQGRTRVGIDALLLSHGVLATQTATHSTINRYLGRKVGHTRVAQDSLAATLQVVDADLDLVIPAGSGLQLTWPESPWWGAHLVDYLIYRQLE